MDIYRYCYEPVYWRMICADSAQRSLLFILASQRRDRWRNKLTNCWMAGIVDIVQGRAYCAIDGTSA